MTRHDIVARSEYWFNVKVSDGFYTSEIAKQFLSTTNPLSMVIFPMLDNKFGMYFSLCFEHESDAQFFKKLFEDFKPEPSYVYRNLPCTIVSNDKLWCVSGHDEKRSADGVLEWCYDQSDAEHQKDLMEKFSRFSHLQVHKYLSTERSA